MSQRGFLLSFACPTLFSITNYLKFWLTDFKGYFLGRFMALRHTERLLMFWEPASSVYTKMTNSNGQIFIKFPCDLYAPLEDEHFFIYGKSMTFSLSSPSSRDVNLCSKICHYRMGRLPWNLSILIMFLRGWKLLLNFLLRLQEKQRCWYVHSFQQFCIMGYIQKH